MITSGRIEFESFSVSLEDLFRIEVTSTYRPDGREGDSGIEPIYSDGQGNESCPYTREICCGNTVKRPKSTLMEFRSRNCTNKTGRVIYLVLKIFYISFWFYFGAHYVLLKSYLNPFYGKTFRGVKGDLFDGYIEYMDGDPFGKENVADEPYLYEHWEFELENLSPLPYWDNFWYLEWNDDLEIFDKINSDVYSFAFILYSDLMSQQAAMLD